LKLNVDGFVKESITFSIVIYGFFGIIILVIRELKLNV